MKSSHLAFVLAIWLSVLCLSGCGKPESRLIGHWKSAKDNSTFNIEKNGEVFTIEIIPASGSPAKIPATYKDGVLAAQAGWMTITIYSDKNSGDLIVNVGGQEERLTRQ